MLGIELAVVAVHILLIFDHAVDIGLRCLARGEPDVIYAVRPRGILREYAHEGDFAPAGKSLIQTMVYCSEKECRRFIELKKDPAAYREYKKAIADETMALIERRYPVLQGKLQCLDVWTPATYKRYTGADVGSYMGFVFPKKLNPIFMSGKFKGLANVYLATQWQQAPGGLPVAAKAGEAAIKAILKRDQKKVKA